MGTEELSRAYKVSVVGCAKAGKSAVAERILRNRFVANLAMTRSVVIEAVRGEYQEKTFDLVLWDCTATASLVGPFTQESDVVFLVVDATRFEHTAQYLLDLGHFDSKARILVVNKMDAVDEQSRPTPEAIAQLARNLSCTYTCKVSAKTGMGMPALKQASMQAVATCQLARKEALREEENAEAEVTLEPALSDRPASLGRQFKAFFEKTLPAAGFRRKLGHGQNQSAAPMIELSEMRFGQIRQARPTAM